MPRGGGKGGKSKEKRVEGPAYERTEEDRGRQPVRASTTDDIACWFIDTDYDEESFFVRHAYFLGAKDPYERLKRTLKAEIDEPAWATLYRATSRPFPKPKRGRIAVKVINHYGDDVLKFYSV